MKDLIDTMITSNNKVREFLEEIKSLQYEEIYSNQIINLEERKKKKEDLEAKINQFYQLQNDYEKAIMEIIFVDNCIVFRKE